MYGYEDKLLNNMAGELRAEYTCQADVIISTRSLARLVEAQLWGNQNKTCARKRYCSLS